MSKSVTVLEADPAARKAFEKILKKEGLKDVCGIEAPEAAVPTASTYVRLLEPGKATPAMQGAHDFTKPVRAGVVIQHVKRLLAANSGEETVLFNTYTLNSFNHELVNTVTGEGTRLTEKESHILKLLAQNPGKTVSRKTLLENVWQYADGLETHTLETHIYRLRQKIEKDPANPSILITEDAGYRLN